MSNLKTPSEYEKKLIRDAVTVNRGGKDAIDRMLTAYGFSTKMALCSHLGISQSTMANRVSRDTFPADWLLICLAETGASLTWLVTGKGQPFIHADNSRIVILEKKNISNGHLESAGDFVQDVGALPDGLSDPFIVESGNTSYLVDSYAGEIVDGTWLIEMDNLASVRELARFPGGRIRVENGKSSFECKTDEIKVLGKVILRTEHV